MSPSKHQDYNQLVRMAIGNYGMIRCPETKRHNMNFWKTIVHNSSSYILIIEAHFLDFYTWNPYCNMTVFNVTVAGMDWPNAFAHNITVVSLLLIGSTLWASNTWLFGILFAPNLDELFPWINAVKIGPMWTNLKFDFIDMKKSNFPSILILIFDFSCKYRRLISN